MDRIHVGTRASGHVAVSASPVPHARGRGEQEEALTLRAHLAGIYVVALSPDGRRPAAGGGDLYLRLWDATPWQVE
jgi:hypothetical protein